MRINKNSVPSILFIAYLFSFISCGVKEKSTIKPEKFKLDNDVALLVFDAGNILQNQTLVLCFGNVVG